MPSPKDREYVIRYSTQTRSKSSLLEILAYNTRVLKV